MVLSDKSESIRNAIKRARDSGLDLPPSPRDAQKEEYPSYNIKVLCNVRGGRAGDHHPYPASGDRALLEWANKDILG